MTTIDQETGEILDHLPGETRAADGAIVPPAARTGGDIINQLEDGAFQADMHAAMADLLAHMQDVAQEGGNKVKGSMSMKLDIVYEDGAFRIASKFDVKKPDMPRPRSIMWCDEHNNLTRFPPQQRQLFGMKSAGGAGGLRRA